MIPDEPHQAGPAETRVSRAFDPACLTPVRSLTPVQVRALREREGVTQAVFARHLNVCKSLVSHWESGRSQPQGTTLKLLSLVVAKGLAAIA